MMAIKRPIIKSDKKKKSDIKIWLKMEKNLGVFTYDLDTVKVDKLAGKIVATWVLSKRMTILPLTKESTIISGELVLKIWGNKELLSYKILISSIEVTISFFMVRNLLKTSSRLYYHRMIVGIKLHILFLKWDLTDIY